MLDRPTKEDPMFTFSCNGCGKVAGKSDDESVALKGARAQPGWEWTHPCWHIFCPDCKRAQRRR